ncbi:MAG: winged helix-turn-helix domain-containing protein [Woeseiaceae bacterium]
MRRTSLSIAEARRIALAAQGFDRQRPAVPNDVRHFRRVFNTLNLLQLDYVNVLMPAHFLIPWSRLGAYDRGRFEDYVYSSGECTEQWAHEASIVPADAWPLLEHRRASHTMHKNNPLRRIRNRSAYLDAALKQVECDGALTANDLPPVPGPKRKAGDWHRSIPRWALEYHFATGALAVADRLPNFQRVYDLPSRVIAQEHLSSRIEKSDAQRELLRRAAASLGVATLQDLADYFRMTATQVSPLVDDLVHAGDIAAVRVEGWDEPAYLFADAKIPRQISGESLLSPFDPVVWFRPRALRLFGFHYRIEIYVPASKRKWGYYVLPFRVGDQIVARVDLKADRKNKKLLVLAVHEETHTELGACVDSLARELNSLSAWLGFEQISVTRHNAISRRLATAIRSRTRP